MNLRSILFYFYTICYIFVFYFVDIVSFHLIIKTDSYTLENKKKWKKEMKEKYNIQDFLEMYYLDSNIPAYFYQNRVPGFCVPPQSGLTYPPKKYLDILFENPKRLSYCSTDYGIYYGCLRLDGFENGCLIFGPVGNIPFYNADLHKLYADYLISDEQKEAFTKYLGTIPQISLAPFITKLLFINYCLHGEKLSLTDFIPYELSVFSDSASVTEENYKNKEDLYHNRSYELESLTLNYIRAGNPHGFLELKTNETHFHLGITGPTALRQLKNNIVITTTLSTRAAIEGGLDYDTAYQLSDKFIQTGEKLQNADSLYELLSKIGYTFAQKVYEAKTPVTSNDRIQKAVRFIQQNTNQHITVGDVADHVGFSRSYFSSYFKQELGFSISAFILRCKLEEGRELLSYTDKSLSVISNYLCFSSQSHFQTAFKKQFGVTPLEYRKNHS